MWCSSSCFQVRVAKKKPDIEDLDCLTDSSIAHMKTTSRSMTTAYLPYKLHIIGTQFNQDFNLRCYDCLTFPRKPSGHDCLSFNKCKDIGKIGLLVQDQHKKGRDTDRQIQPTNFSLGIGSLSWHKLTVSLWWPGRPLTPLLGPMISWVTQTYWKISRQVSFC